MNKKIAIYGPYPPPLGGISVHIKRMVPFLKKANLDYTIFDFGYTEKENVIPTKKSIFWYLKILFNRQFDLLHFHQLFAFEFIFYYIFSIINRTEAIVSIHSERLLKYSSTYRDMNLFFLKKSKLKVIAVSKNLTDLLLKSGIDVVFLPAYVPPEDIVFKPIKKDQRVYFLYSVWKLDKKLGDEIYNVPLVSKFLSENKLNYKMLFLIGNKEISDLNYLNKMIKEYDIAESVEILYGKNLVDYVQNCSFLLKTNYVDGYGVALQEAMDLGVPAIASDVCIRPKGTVLFKDDDLGDLKLKINHTMSQPVESILKEKEELQYHLELIKIYKNSLIKQS